MSKVLTILAFALVSPFILLGVVWGVAWIFVGMAVGIARVGFNTGYATVKPV